MCDFEAHASAHFERHPLKGRHSFQEGPFPVFWATSAFKSDKVFDLKAMCFVAQHTYNAQPPSHAPCVCVLTRVPNSCRRHKWFFYLGCIPTVVTKKRDSITSHLRLFYTLTRKFRCVDENEAQLATIWDINNTFCSGTISCISTACLTNRIYTYFFYIYVSQDRRTILN